MTWKKIFPALFASVGVIGSAFTLISTADQLVGLTNWARAIIAIWKTWESYAWHHVLQAFGLTDGFSGGPILPHPVLQSLLSMNVFLLNIAIGTRFNLLVSGGQGRKLDNIEDPLRLTLRAIQYALPTLLVMTLFVWVGGLDLIASSEGTETFGSTLDKALGHNLGFDLLIVLCGLLPVMLQVFSGSEIEFGIKLWRAVIAAAAFVGVNEFCKLFLSA
jgi:hypothetical protein